MKTLVGGAVAAALGLIGMGVWWADFLMVLKGTIPALLLLGGGLPSNELPLSQRVAPCVSCDGQVAAPSA